MPLSEVSPPWYASPYGGLFGRCGPVPRRPHDPAVFAWSGTLPHWGPGGADLATGGAGWDEESAELAGVGEAVERWLPHPLPQDGGVEAAYDCWPLDEPAVEPGRWVHFHAEQYAQPGFPFEPCARRTRCRWVCCRRLGTGEAWWAPEEMVFLSTRSGARQRLTPGLSTGLSCGRVGDPVLLRGLQEVIERDALVGAWWGRYALEEHEPEKVFAGLGGDLPTRLRRPNLRYRCYRVASPFSSHVTLVTLAGQDREGHCFSAGSACRETRAASWRKGFLEAVQGRHYVRYLKAAGAASEGPPADFAGHAVYYSLHPEELGRTPLEHARPANTEGEGTEEGWPELAERLGSERPVLFRHLTPPPLAAEGLGWVVLRVLVPGLQPLHGHHGYPFLGGPLWAPRGTADWQAVPPHPFP
ncbi:MAG TPA: YcaO-like family protein [Gemmataceae bacterium]|nr:YcaO-like family protein [Gemmataceae bacterium]